MSQNVTLSELISPTQSLAVWALVNGMSVTKAAEKAGVARETVSRWLHRDPVFIAELQNKRAETAVQTRCALESLGQQAIAALREAVAGYNLRGTKLRAACAILKMLGADKAQTLPDTTAEEMYVRLLQREEELQKQQGKLQASETATEAKAIAAPRSQEVHAIQQPESSSDVNDEADSAQAPAIEPAREQPLPAPEGKPSETAEERPMKSGAERGTCATEDVAGEFHAVDHASADCMAPAALLHRTPNRCQRSAAPLPVDQDLYRTSGCQPITS